MNIPSPFKSDCLSGKIAIVTGGGSGICFEITKQLLLHGAAGAVICGRRENFLKRSAKILQNETGKICHYHVLDVRNAQACRDVVQYTMNAFNRLDILVNGAAGNFLSPASELSPNGFATVMAIDAMGTFNMSSAAHPALSKTAKKLQGHNNNDDNNKSNNSGVIINISATLQSPATHWQVHPSAAKAAVDSMTRSLALEWGRDQIRVCGIAPGPIADTPGTTKLAPNFSADDINEMIGEGIPLGRMGEAIEIGHCAVYLATAQYCTGDVIIVDGGEWLYKPPMVPKEFVQELSRKVESKSRAQAPQSRL